MSPSGKCVVLARPKNSSYKGTRCRYMCLNCIRYLSSGDGSLRYDVRQMGKQGYRSPMVSLNGLRRNVKCFRVFLPSPQRRVIY